MNGSQWERSVTEHRAWLIAYRRWVDRVERVHNARRMWPEVLGYRYLYR